MIDLNLNGHNALVCGASSGIGLATAVELADHGSNVILLARNEDKLETALAMLPKAMDQKHKYIVCDLSNVDQIQYELSGMLQGIPVDILINNCGGPEPGLMAEASLQQIDQAIRTHLYANIALVNVVLPSMKGNQYGRIVNITSTSVKSPIEMLGVSNTVRWSVTAWAKTLSYEIAKYGITVNNILPGYIDTDRLHSIIKYRADTSKVSYEEEYSTIIDSIPANRIGHPKEIAQVITFLSSPASSYINGVAFTVDGGRTKVI